MRSCGKRLAAGLAVGLLALVRGTGADDALLPLRDVQIPIEQHPDGSPKVLLKAAAAHVPPAGEIYARGVRVELYDERGQLDGVVRAADCRYDREQRVACSDGAVEMEGRGLRLAGTGFEWHVAEQRVRIKADVRVAFSRDLRRTRPTGSGGSEAGGKAKP